VNGGLRTGRSCLSGRLVQTGFLMMLLCSFILIGQTRAQEVIVARETKPEPPKQPAPPPQQTPSESATPEQTKPKSRSKKSTSAEPTLEQMRMAGALAAERLNNPSSSQGDRSGQSDSEAAPVPSPAVPETPRPAKRETRSEQTSTSRRPSPRPGKPEAVGAVRPTLMESGREQPSASPSPTGQTPVP
jgi:cytoskeletal protein RodZ